MGAPIFKGFHALPPSTMYSLQTWIKQSRAWCYILGFASWKKEQVLFCIFLFLSLWYLQRRGTMPSSLCNYNNNAFILRVQDSGIQRTFLAPKLPRVCVWVCMCVSLLGGVWVCVCFTVRWNVCVSVCFAGRWSVSVYVCFTVRWVGVWEDRKIRCGHSLRVCPHLPYRHFPFNVTTLYWTVEQGGLWGSLQSCVSTSGDYRMTWASGVRGSPIKRA